MSFWYGADGTKAGVRAEIERRQPYTGAAKAEILVKQAVLDIIDALHEKPGYGLSIKASGHVSTDLSQSTISIEIKEFPLYLDPEKEVQDGSDSAS